MKATCVICNLYAALKVDMASRQRYFDAAFLVGRSLWIFHPYDRDAIRLLLNAVAAHEKNVSDRADLEYQLQIMMSSSALFHC